MSLPKLRHQDHYIAVTRELREAGYGWTEESGGKHARLVVDVGGREETIIMSVSPSDHRAAANAVGDIRRRIRSWKAEAADAAAPDLFQTMEVAGTMDDMPSSTRSAMELIAPVDREISGVSVQTVNGRDLHVFLQNRDHFVTWFRDRVRQYGFSEGIDFVSYSENSEKGAPRIEHAVTIDMAKELSMVERNSQGKAARRYFIECERLAKEAAAQKASPTQQVMAALNDPASLRRLLLDNVEKVLVLEAELEEAKPAAAAYDHLTRTNGTLCLTDAAKTLGIRRDDLASRMQSRKWIYRRAGNGHWVGYQDKVQQGLLDHRLTEISNRDGNVRIAEQVRVTAKGMAILSKAVVHA